MFSNYKIDVLSLFVVVIKGIERNLKGKVVIWEDKVLIKYK